MVLEERGYPSNEGGREAIQAEGVEEAWRVDVVKEALDVEEESCGNMTVGDGRLGQVGQVCSAINGRTVVLAAELQGAKEREYIEVGHEALGDNFFQKLAASF